LGLCPCSVVEDMQGRLRRYRDAGASGVMMRTDWEIISQSSVFSSFNTLNLVAGALLSRDVDTPLDAVYARWAADGVVSPLVADSVPQTAFHAADRQSVDALTRLMRLGWQILERTIYVRGHVFQENCQFPDTVGLAFLMMVDFHRRDHWEPGAHLRVEPTDENVEAVFAE